MKDSFCNESNLSTDIPELMANSVLGIEQLMKIQLRYQQMLNCYDHSYDEWQKAFTEDLRPFRAYSDTTAVTIPINHPKFGGTIAALNKGLSA